MSSGPIQTRYELHLNATAEWLLHSIRKGKGGSCAHWSPFLGWSAPYPETTGYLIPTLLKLHAHFDDARFREAALGCGRWLLDIQNHDGSWNGGLHRPGAAGVPSVFNTGQILKGLATLFDATGDDHWIDAGARGAAWLSASMGDSGLWEVHDYRSPETPTYYAHVLWPMLEIHARRAIPGLEPKVRLGLAALLARRASDGSFAGMAFEPGKPAFTHTMAYTFRGFLECARLLQDWETYGAPVVAPLERIWRQSELRGGRLQGAFEANGRGEAGFECLTGHAQMALCLLLWESRAPDLRLVNGVAKLIDAVCDSQRLSSFLPSGLRGAVPGSRPLWGPYMRGRYPNWAAKYHADALMALLGRLDAPDVA